MYHLGKGSYFWLASAALVLAVAPAQAQSSASTNKFLLDPNPPTSALDAATLDALNQTLGAAKALSNPTAVAPAGGKPATTQVEQAAIMQGILTGMGAIQAAVDSQPPPPSPATGPAATPAELAAAIAQQAERLRQEKRDDVLAAAEATRVAAIAGDSVPTTSRKQPVAPTAGAATPPPAGTTAPPSASSMDAAMVADLVNRPDVVAAVRDMTITAALRGWDDAFVAAWPDYAANNRATSRANPSAFYRGTALAIMPDGTQSTGSLNFGLGASGYTGELTFASANPDLSATLLFNSFYYGPPGGPETGGFLNNASAFGGASTLGRWVGDFYGSGGDVFVADWSVAVTGGPNAGTVIGKFGGQQ